MERLAAGGIPAVRRAVAEERERARSRAARGHRRGDPGPRRTGCALGQAGDLAGPGGSGTRTTRPDLAPRPADDRRRGGAPRRDGEKSSTASSVRSWTRPLAELCTNWEEQYTHALEEGRVLQALRLSAQPPEPTARFPAGLVERLAASAGAAMTKTTPTERWLAIPRPPPARRFGGRFIRKVSPTIRSGEVLRRARLAAGSLPALAPLLGLSMPPPPKPLRPARPPRPPRPARPPAAGPAAPPEPEVAARAGARAAGVRAGGSA